VKTKERISESVNIIKKFYNPRKSACPVAPVDGTGRPKHKGEKK